MRASLQRSPLQQPVTADGLRRGTASPAASRAVHPMLPWPGRAGNPATQQLLPAQLKALDAPRAPAVTTGFGHTVGESRARATWLPGLQAKRQGASPEDLDEQEADRAADQVMRMQEPRLKRACACGGECASCRTAQPAGARSASSQASDPGRTVLTSTTGDLFGSPGRPLDPAARAFMEPRFGHDFSAVRVHTDARAAASAEALGASAFTLGGDIGFGAGRYLPATSEGRHLLAHELAHIIQQHSAPHPPGIQRQPAPTPPPPLQACTTSHVDAVTKIKAAVAQAGAMADAAVKGLQDLIAHWGRASTAPQTATGMGLRFGFGIEVDKSFWGSTGSKAAEVKAVDDRDKAAAATVLANFQQIQADLPKYTSAPLCPVTASGALPTGTPCFACATPEYPRCRADAVAMAPIGTPSSWFRLCPVFFAKDPLEAGEILVHEAAHAQLFAASDTTMAAPPDVSYYGCPVMPVTWDPLNKRWQFESLAPGLIEPAQFIGIADSYACFVKTQRTYAAEYAAAERGAAEAKRVTREILSPTKP